jgi:hypothetical protein
MLVQGIPNDGMGPICQLGNLAKTTTLLIRRYYEFLNFGSQFAIRLGRGRASKARQRAQDWARWGKHAFHSGFRDWAL